MVNYGVISASLKSRILELVLGKSFHLSSQIYILFMERRCRKVSNFGCFSRLLAWGGVAWRFAVVIISSVSTNFQVSPMFLLGFGGYMCHLLYNILKQKDFPAPRVLRTLEFGILLLLLDKSTLENLEFFWYLYDFSSLGFLIALRNIKKYQAIEAWIRKLAIGIARGFYFRTKKWPKNSLHFAHYYGSFLVINQVFGIQLLLLFSLMSSITQLSKKLLLLTVLKILLNAS